MAFGLLQRQRDEAGLEGLLWMRFAPEARADELGREVIAWGEARLRALGAEAGAPTRLCSGAGGADAWRLALLEASGFAPIRYFLRMERALDEVEAPALPPGFTLRTVDPAEGAAWADLFNESFVDHWNHHPLSAERLAEIWAEPLYRRDLDWVVVAPDGALAAFCACELRADDPEGLGWIEVLGSRRGYRGLGLGKAALLAGMAALRGAGARRAGLIVDAESLTGATRLYERAGFAVTRRSTRFARPLEQP